MSVDLITADAVKWAEEYDGPLFHALFCDAPYHLTTITKRFGKEGSAPAKFGKDGAFQRISMGHSDAQYSSYRCAGSILNGIKFDDMNNGESKIGDDFLSFPISIDNSLVVFMISAINFKDDISSREIKINAVSAIPIVNNVLVNEIDSKTSQSIRNINFYLRVREGFSRCVGHCSCFSKIRKSLFGINVWLTYNALGDSKSSSDVLTGGRTKTRAILTLDLTRRTAKLLPADSTGEFNASFEFVFSENIGTPTGASSLSSPLESGGISKIDSSTHRTVSFNIVFHKSLLDIIRPIIPQVGFMGMTWDNDVAFRPETWYAFGKVLYPGAFGIAYASSRGYHRMAVAIEDAGFIVHPMIGWLQAQGMPKATRIDTQIQKRSEQKVIGSKLGTPGYSMTDAENQGNTLGWSKSKRSGKAECEILEPTDDLAKAWVGHRYGLQALAPSLEPICVFQKPYEGRPLDNITETGAGALNIDAARIPSAEPYTINTWDDDAHPFGDGAGNPYTSRQETGRWPKNLIIDEQAAEIVDRQSGISKSTGGRSGHTGAYGGGYKQEYYGDKKPGYGDTGTVSRFFFQVQNQIDEADPIYYCPKVSPRERNEGLDSLPDQLYAQSGGAPARLQDGDDEYKQDSMGMNRIQKVKNPHPTLKPISLNEYLAKLLLPPALYAPRRLFVPFAGVASEAIGAGLAGWEEVVAVEWLEEYAEIGKKRVVYWMGKPKQITMEV